MFNQAWKAAVERIYKDSIPKESWTYYTGRLVEQGEVFGRKDLKDKRKTIFSLVPYTETDGISIDDIQPDVARREVLFDALNDNTFESGIETQKGVQEGSIVLINGSKGAGKSWMMLRCALAAAQKGEKVAYFATEMKAGEYQKRATQMLLGKVDVSLAERKAALAGLSIQMVECPASLTVDWILSKAADATLIVLDYARHAAFGESKDAAQVLGSPIELIFAKFERLLGNRILITGRQLVPGEKKDDKTLAGGGERNLFTPAYSFSILKKGKKNGTEFRAFTVLVDKSRGGCEEGDVIRLTLNLRTQELKPSVCDTEEEE
ncbi:MAG: AAA family ATPase [Myxococcota bacterium]